MNAVEQIVIGTQVTSRYGPGIVQWIEGPIFTVRIYSDPYSAAPRDLTCDQIAFWPPREQADTGDRS